MRLYILSGITGATATCVLGESGILAKSVERLVESTNVSKDRRTNTRRISDNELDSKGFGDGVLVGYILKDTYSTTDSSACSTAVCC